MASKQEALDLLAQWKESDGKIQQTQSLHALPRSSRKKLWNLAGSKTKAKLNLPLLR